MKQNTITFQHSKETILALSQAQFRAVNQVQTVLVELVCAGCLVFGALTASGGAGSILIMAIGVLGLTMTLDTPNRRAKQVLNRLHGAYPGVSYTLLSSSMTIAFDGRVESHAYTEFTRLIEDKRYLYLQRGTEGIYIIPKEQVRQTQEMKSFLAEKTGRKWSKNQGVLQVSLQDLAARFRK